MKNTMHKVKWVKPPAGCLDYCLEDGVELGEVNNHIVKDEIYLRVSLMRELGRLKKASFNSKKAMWTVLFFFL